jgi:transposase-like protein
MSRQRKRDAVLRLLRGEDLETVSRALGIAAATLSGWRDAFLEAGKLGDTAPLRQGAGERTAQGQCRIRRC